MTKLAVLSTHPVQYYSPLLRELAKRVDLHVFYSHNPSPNEQGEGFDQAFRWDVDLLAGYSHSFLANVSTDPSPKKADTPEIGSRLDASNFDALLTLGWYTRSLRQGIAAALWRGMPVLVRGDSQLGLTTGILRRAAKGALYPFALRAFGAVLPVGTRNADFYAHYGYPRDRMFASPHAVDTAFFSARATKSAGAALRDAHNIAADARVILFAGKLVDFKRPLDVVHAAAQLGNVELLIAGSGPLQNEIRARAHEVGVTIHFLGFVNQGGMPAVYAAADVLCLPSTARETWGLVVNEALASGTPVVVSDAAGCAPDICDGRAGISYPCGDISALAAALKRALLGPDLDAIKIRSDAHTLARAADGIVRALEAVCARSSAATATGC